MRIVELILDEDQEISGIEAISIVENPAIEEDFVALKNQEIKLAEVDSEKRILLGALLIPNKPIYRRNGEDEYYIYFSKDTVLKASQLYLQKGNQNNSTLEHQHSIQGLSLVESWIIEDEVHDKSRKYNMELPVGTWMGAVKVNNEDIWNEYVKTGKVKGFSIEGYFADKMERPNEQINDFADVEAEAQELLSEIKGIVRNDKRYKSGKKMIMESYSDYPNGVKNNAKKGIDLNKKVNNKCATDVGKIRAQQLAQGKPISKETIKRMYSYLSRAEGVYREKQNDSQACGNISYLLWGGLAALSWSRNKLRELGLLEEGDVGNPSIPNSSYPGQSSSMISGSISLEDIGSLEEAIQKVEETIGLEKVGSYDGLPLYKEESEAIMVANEIGCEGAHQHELNGEMLWMPCEKHSDTQDRLLKDVD